MPTPAVSTTENIYRKTKYSDPNFDKVIRLWQSAVGSLFRLILSPYHESSTMLLEATDFEPDTTYVISSNHQAGLDTFVFLAIVSGDIKKRLLPCRTFVLNQFFDSPVLNYFLIRMGCFPAKRVPGYLTGMDFARQELKRGRVLMIFPEAGRRLRGEAEARPGVAALAREQGVKIIPAHIEWRRKSYLRRKFRVTMGKPFDGSKMSPQEILDRSYSLPV